MTNKNKSTKRGTHKVSTTKSTNDDKIHPIQKDRKWEPRNEGRGTTAPETRQSTKFFSREERVRIKRGGETSPPKEIQKKSNENEWGTSPPKEKSKERTKCPGINKWDAPTRGRGSPRPPETINNAHLRISDRNVQFFLKMSRRMTRAWKN